MGAEKGGANHCLPSGWSISAVAAIKSRRSLGHVKHATRELLLKIDPTPLHKAYCEELQLLIYLDHHS